MKINEIICREAKVGSTLAEDQDTYLQDPLDPEGDTDGPGKTGDEDDLGEGDVVQFKRLALGSDTPNLGMARQLAKELFWTQVSSHYTAEEEAEERELEQKLAKIGFEAKWDHDEPEFTMVLTHKPSGRQLRMGEDELVDESTVLEEGMLDMIRLQMARLKQRYGNVSLETLRDLADRAAEAIPGKAATMQTLKSIGTVAAKAGIPLLALAAMASVTAYGADRGNAQAAVDMDKLIAGIQAQLDALPTEQERNAFLANYLRSRLTPDPPVKNYLTDPEAKKNFIKSWEPEGDEKIIILKGGGKKGVPVWSGSTNEPPPLNDSEAELMRKLLDSLDGAQSK